MQDLYGLQSLHGGFCITCEFCVARFAFPTKFVCRKVCIACKVRKACVLASRTMFVIPADLVSPGKAAGDRRLVLGLRLLLVESSSAGRPSILE